MKKVLRAITAAILLVSVLVLSVGCGSNESDEQPESEYEVTTDYYGCPNSKRVKKLNLMKNKKSIEF